MNPGDVLAGGRFRIEAELGSGTMGIAYRALDARLGRAVALKTLHRSDAEHVYELKREFRRLAGLSHPHLVKLYELFASDAECFFTMELLDGSDLVAGLRNGVDGPLVGEQQARLCAVLLQLTRGLQALHAYGQVHRDLKPSNVLLTSAARVVLLDFGLASPLSEARVRGPRDVFHGSLVYAAPEQFWGAAAGEAADWYAVGAMLFELLTGQLPFHGSFEELVFVKQSRAAPRPSQLVDGVAPALDDLVVRLLDVRPEGRPDAAEVLAVLAAGARAATAPPAPSPVPKVSGPFVGRSAEIAELARWLGEVRDRGAAVGHVRGVSGVGKTELVQRFLASLPADAAIVLGGRCHAQESVPFKAMDPLVDELSHVLSEEVVAPVSRLPAEQRDALRRLFPVLARVPELGGATGPEAPSEPQEIRRRGFRALRGLLGELAARAPVVLWIDDAQWGDLDSASLLRELLRGPEAPRLLLLLTYPAESEDRGALLDALEAEDALAPDHRLDVGPLGPEQSQALVEQMLGGPSAASDVLKARIAAESAGSPFFVGELVRYLAQRPAEPQSLVESLGIAQVTMARVERLAPGALDLLELVAVASGPIAGEVVLDASGVGAAGWPLLLDLCGQCLLREGGSRGERPETVEAYHDRIRETLLATLGDAPERLRRRHLQLAETLLARPHADPQDLLQHLLGAGDEARAAEHALRAAEQASAALAFERAAELYATALRLRGHGDGDWPLRVRRAQMLAAAGRHAAAAQLLEEAARAAATTSDSEQAASLHGQAAEQYLYAGLLAEGTRVLREVLQHLEVPVPRDPRAAMRVSLRLRLRFLLRGARVAPIDPRQVSPQRLMRLDALYGAARGTVMLDHRLADALAMQHLLGALELGEPSRALRALCMEASSEANVGGRWLRRRSWSLLEDAATLASATGAPYDRAVVLVNRGAVALFSARFRDAVAACEEALELFRSRCVGAAWEVTVCQSFVVAALAQLGEVRALRERTGVLIEEARARGDRYSSAFFQSGDCVLEALGRDDPAGAHAGADAALIGVPDEHFTSLHFGHLVAVVRVHLYRADGARAWALITEAWPRLRAGGFLSLEGIGLVLHYLRGCAALAALESLDGTASGSWQARRTASFLRREATRAARRLRRLTLPTGPPLAAALVAGIHASRGESEPRAAALAQAIELFDAADMALHRESARLLLGLVGGDEAHAGRARAWMAEQEVRAPIALARATIPGPFPYSAARDPEPARA